MAVDMSRRQDLAGQSVKQGGYTVTYDENGMARSAKKDGGKSATSTVKTTKANDSAAHQEAYQAAQRGDWDAVGAAVSKIGETTPDGHGGYDMSEANAYLKELADEFKYNAKDYTNQKYDQTYGTGSSDVYDATNGAVKSYQSLVDAVGESTTNQYLSQYGGDSTSGGTTSTGGVQYSTPDVDDTTQYINDLYAQNLEAELAALKSAYDKNVAEMESQNDKIAEQYRTARNQVAGQNALERQRMNEFASAQGLNTGTFGQTALSQSAAYQGSLGNLYAQEAQNQADVGQALAQLTAEYNGNVQQTTASNNTQRLAALIEAQAQQKEQAYSLAFTMLQNGIMPDEATLSAAGLSVGNAEAIAQMYQGSAADASKPTLTAAQTLSALKDGIVNDTTMAAYEYYYGQPYSTGAPVQAATPTPVRTGGTYNNGSLTSAQVKQMQTDINKWRIADGLAPIAEDGLWGAATSEAAGGLTADEYATIYYKQNSWSGRSDR